MADVELRGLQRAADRLRLADDPQLHPDRQPHRARAAWERQRVRRDLAGRLGHPVGLDHRDPRARLEPVGGGDGQRRRRRPDEPDAAGDGLVRPGIGQTRDDGGNGVDPGDRPRRAMSSQKAVRWNRSSRTRQEPATSADSNPTTSALMWNRGSGLKPRSSGPSSMVRRHAGRRVEQLLLAQPDDLGGPVVPDEDSTTPPAPARCGAVAPGRGHRRPASRRSMRSSSTHAASMPAGSGPIGHHHVGAGARQGGCQAALAGRGHGRVERCHPEPGGDGPEEGVGEGQRVADGEADGREATRRGSLRGGPATAPCSVPARRKDSVPPSRACSM